MNYLTLHELARQFNKPERQIRYRFRELLKERKLTEGEDFRKDDFVDEFHFAYKINPLRFMEEAKLVIDHQAVDNIANALDEFGSNLDNKDQRFASKPDGAGSQSGNQHAQLDTKEDVQPEPIGTQEKNSGYQVDSNAPEIVTKVENQDREFASNVATKIPVGTNENILMDYIETLKEQLHVKDGQIEDYKKQVEDQADVSRRAIGEVLKMKDQVMQLKAGIAEGSRHQQIWDSPEHSQDQAEPVGEDVQENREFPG